VSQRDLAAELRASRVTAPDEVREHVRLIAAAETAPPRKFTWRRALVVTLPVAAAIAAAIVFTRPDHQQRVVHGVVVTTPDRALDKLDKLGAPARTPALQAQVGAAGSTAGEPKAFAPVPPRGRVVQYDAALSLRVASPTAVSAAVKRALRIATSLGGFPISVHASTQAKSGTADLTLKIPRQHVQEAVARLSALGTITGEQVDLQDLQAGINATNPIYEIGDAFGKNNISAGITDQSGDAVSNKGDGNADFNEPRSGVDPLSATQGFQLPTTLTQAGNVLIGPSGAPAAVGPTDNNDDYTNKSVAPAAIAGLSHLDTLGAAASVDFTNTVQNTGNADDTFTLTAPTVPAGFTVAVSTNGGTSFTTVSGGGSTTLAVAFGGTEVKPGLVVRASSVDVRCADDAVIPRLAAAVRGRQQQARLRVSGGFREQVCRPEPRRRGIRLEQGRCTQQLEIGGGSGRQAGNSAYETRPAGPEGASRRRGAGI